MVTQAPPADAVFRRPGGDSSSYVKRGRARRWVANLDANSDAAEAEIGTARLRVWRLYLLGCAQAFEDGEIGVYQVLGARVGGPHEMPLDRAHLAASRLRPGAEALRDSRAPESRGR
jgi:hypothetical protein